MPQQQVLVCVPCDLARQHMPDFPANAPYSAYVITGCPQCHDPMYIGARGLALVESGEAEAMCMTCAIKLGLVDADTPMGLLTDRDQ